MPRKGENIYKRKDGRWEGRYIKGRSPDGKSIYKSVYGKTYRIAKEKLQSAAVDCRITPQDCSIPAVPTFTVNQTQNCDFGSVAQDWLSSLHLQVKDSTYMKYRNLLQSYLLPEFENSPLHTVTAESLRDHCNTLLTEGGTEQKGLSSKTVNDALSVFRCVIRYAQAKGFPTACTGKEITVKHVSKELSIIPKDEQECLYRYLKENPSGKNLGILISMFTGLRLGEVCALKWDDISIQRKTLCVHQTMQRVQVEGNPEKKTEVLITTPKSVCSIRTIPLPDNLRAIIEKDYPCRCGYIMTGSDSKYVEPRGLERYFKRVLKWTGLTSVNFHALRHTFATRCVEVGFDVKTLSEILGHANVSITMDLYVHPTMEMKSENMKKLSDLFTVR